jgi:hypothetical protein
MADSRLLTLATDPNLVPGIYNGCDQWCHYCRATDRCLAHKCRPDLESGRIYQDLEAKVFDSMRYLKACHDAEGLQPPEDLVRLLDGGAPLRAACEPIDDPLERMGKHYALLATAYLASSGGPLPAGSLPRRDHGPTPLDVFLYYHVQIAVKIYRALSSAGEAARTGGAQARWDADVSAKVALLDADRSDEALQLMALDDPDPRIDYMRKHLSRLRRELEARFPAARTLVRPGLDD